MTIRQPIITVMGHVDHGKTSLLDKIRKTAIAKSEAGGITQKISSTNITIGTIKNICGNLLGALNIKLTIPGLLFIDTPGHAAFNNLRKRGGNLADIAVLVIDINEGTKPQTLECINILKQYKTPFIIALNKIDLLTGWRSSSEPLIKNINKQSESVRELLDKRIYEIVSKIYDLEFNSERFDRVDNYTKQVAIVPISAKTGEGIAELLMVLTGLSQKYLEESLKIHVSGPAKGTVLEVKEEKGLGLTLNVIIYDGRLRVNDRIIIGSLGEPIVTKVKALFEHEKNKFKSVKEVNAAAGIKISASDIENVMSGMPIRVVTNLDGDKAEIQKEIEEVIIETDKEGIIVKADSLGSLEALIKLLKENNIMIKRASIGEITKRDISEALSEKNKINRVIAGFNIKDGYSNEVKVVTSDVIYKLIEEIQAWQREEEKKIKQDKLQSYTRPCTIKILPHCIFRKSNPAVVGVEILGGELKAGVPLMKENKSISYVKEIQVEGKSVNSAEKGKSVAISLPHVTVDRQVKENDVLYSDIPEDDFRGLRELKNYLNSDEIEILKKIAEIKRKSNPMWGI